jgi:hypothetical protein
LKSPLVQGIDYYLEEGKFVFTGVYHLKRGYCCNSGCRHCPYKGQAPSGFSLTITGVPTTSPTTAGISSTPKDDGEKEPGKP